MSRVATDTITVARKEYEQLREEHAQLKYQLEELKRMIFGSRSERFVASGPDQLSIFDQASQSDSEDPPTKEVSGYSRKAKATEKQKPVRALLPAHLPREEEIIEPQAVEEGRKKIGEEVTELLEYHPGKLYVRRIVRPKYGLKDNRGVVIAELPSLPIPKGNAGAGLLAHIQVSKWVDHLPYYRQVQMFKRSGITLSESTINGWFTATCDLLTPLYDTLVKQVKATNYLQADESPIAVQDSHKQGATHTGYHWVYHDPINKQVVFDYQPSRSREGPRAFLKDFSGTLQTDGYTAYNDLNPANPEQITLLACMAHARRYFEKALEHDPPRAEHALEVFQKLYAIERRAMEADLDGEQLLRLRQNEAVPILEDFKVWMEDNLSMVLPKSTIGKAFKYTLALWPRLTRYTQNGAWLIDNNQIENTIRPLALGRKNYLFAGSHPAAQRAAMMYSFFATCKIHQVEPLAWLTDVLHRIPEHRANRLSELLPQKWKPGKK